MRLDALDMGHKTHAARIMLVGRRIQTVFLKMLDLGSRRHGALLKNSGLMRIPQCNKSAKHNNWGQIPIISLFITSINNKGQIKNDSYSRNIHGCYNPI
jgi:hypothetical protein